MSVTTPHSCEVYSSCLCRRFQYWNPFARIVWLRELQLTFLQGPFQARVGKCVFGYLVWPWCGPCAFEETRVFLLACVVLDSHLNAMVVQCSVFTFHFLLVWPGQGSMNACWWHGWSIETDSKHKLWAVDDPLCVWEDSLGIEKSAVPNHAACWHTASFRLTLMYLVCVVCLVQCTYCSCEQHMFGLNQEAQKKTCKLIGVRDMVRDRVHGTLALSAKAVAVILCLGAPPILLGTYFYKAKCVEYSI